MEKFEIKTEKLEKPESVLEKLETEKEIPEIKYENICEEIGNNQEFLKQICDKFNIHLIEGMEKSGIDFQSLFENKTGKNLDLA